MRISTNQITSSGVRQMLLRQAELQMTQLQLATQKRVNNPSDDPVAATSINFLNAEIAQLEQFNRNADAADASNKLEESVLSSSTDILFRIRELTVQMGNGALGENELQNIAAEIEERLDELVGLANTRNANGDYLFAGSQVKVKPFSKDAAGNVLYNGDQSKRLLRISSGVVTQTSDSGFDTFVNIFNGNGKFTAQGNAANTGTGIISPGNYQAPPEFLAEDYTITFGTDINGNTTYTVTGDTSASTIIPATVWQEGQAISFNGVTTEIKGAPAAGDTFHIAQSQAENIFAVIQSVVTAAENYASSDAGRAQFNNILNGVQESLNRGMENIDIVRGKIGTRLNAIEQEKNSNLSLLVITRTTLSDVQDLDVVEASTRFSQQLVILEAAQASFARVQDLNLFNFI